ncbi:Hsp33 family molecular chaperone HslO [Simiduia sp. 21SJ11W-1]|uniref:Hsp33 family molecular chaperone HslO n=1 Tax=Simiduia sp. 21SJ11W-1 TaxID=2909669 RepID=UPI00209D1A2C|nr:Hsp33 family molecular chaperone HslO [Simiduia sp. 21SJ11W-1]UTA48081.1 Hsp33 family molecular chaperone HslO [Simiduia sp. 21SJ11W-1]
MSDDQTAATADIMQRFLFEGSDIRGEQVTLAAAYREVLENNPAPAPVQQLLGEMLAAVALLSSTLKFDGIITLQAQGDGPVPLIMAECSRHKALRAIARQPVGGEFVLGADTSLAGLLGKGVLAITIDPEKGERYQGIVPLDKPTLAECLDAYFAQSEQLATRLWLAADGKRAGGLLVQALPKQLVADEQANAEQWDTVVALAHTAKPDELLYLDHSQMLYRLFNELAVRLFDPQPLQFACTCSEQRSLNALAQLNRDELYEILTEQGHITIDCQFCNQQYRFDEPQIRAHLEDLPPTVH